MRSNHNCWIRIANTRINLNELQSFWWTQNESEKQYILEYRYKNLPEIKSLIIKKNCLNHKDFIRIRNKIDELLDVVDLNAEGTNYF